MMSFSVQTYTFFRLWTITHDRLWWRSFYKFNTRGSYTSDFFPNCSFTVLLDISFNSALYCLPLLNFKNSVFSSLSESQFCLDILYFSWSDALPLLFWHVCYTISPKQWCFCAPAAIIWLYGNGFYLHCNTWYSVWSIRVLCTVVEASHLSL